MLCKQNDIIYKKIIRNNCFEKSSNKGHLQFSSGNLFQYHLKLKYLIHFLYCQNLKE